MAIRGEKKMKRNIYSCSGPDLWYDGTADGNDRRGSSKEHA